MNRISNLRDERLLTQKDLAKLTGLSLPSISSYEREIRNPKIEVWQKLSDVFNYPIDYIKGHPNTELAKRIKLALASNDYNEDSLSKKTGVPVSYIQDLEKGTANIVHTYIFKISQLLDLPEWYLSGKLNPENVDPEDEEKDPEATWFDDLPEEQKIEFTEQVGARKIKTIALLKEVSIKADNNQLDWRELEFLMSSMQLFENNDKNNSLYRLAKLLNSIDLYQINMIAYNETKRKETKKELAEELLNILDNIEPVKISKRYADIDY